MNRTRIDDAGARRPAAFLDRDGVLNVDHGYAHRAEQLQWIQGAQESVRLLNQFGYYVLVISNQSGVARGYFDETAVKSFHARMQRELAQHGARVDAFYYCPHHPNGKIPQYATECNCRKPKPGLIQKAVLKYMIDLTDSWLVGDILNDIEAGNRAGCRTIPIDNGNETEWKISPLRQPAFVAQSLYEASSFIIRESHVERNVS